MEDVHAQSEVRMRHSLRGNILTMGAWTTVILAFLTLLGSIPALPLSSCVAPWGMHMDGDQAIPNWMGCITDLARRTGRVGFCDTLSDGFLHSDCITAVALFQR